ncbi:Profilin protein [Aspergillus oryzae]|uniref:Profilin n=1 Tax=Aspergillus oryzae TaxID=5062 RepID=A0A1S9DPK2_ASPOZ|nr:uncharacterized protein G4B84_006044 [Aspergillus flavus NRRL3357]OOO10981.1 Profilin protein [Aspergillus oryzae]QMW30663.1 hypothetical protein G4B84_006044 [Aspergillus flavus NRRL3357]QMW42716.1 hypothetical protein G4B11_006086 [Aspergillus flavus]
MSGHSAVWQGYVDSRYNTSPKAFSYYPTSAIRSSARQLSTVQFAGLAAVLSYNLSGIEAKSSGFSISAEELQGLAAAFAQSNVAMANGIKVGGEKFVAIKADDRSLYGKKGKEGIIVVKTPSCVLVAHHGENVQTTNASAAVEKIADYIINPHQ